MVEGNLAVHDLLFFEQNTKLIVPMALPDWTKEILKRCPIGIIRRDMFKDNLVPIGIRGLNKSQRLAAYLPKDKIVQRLTPKKILQDYLQGKMQPLDASLPLWQSLEKNIPLLTSLAMEVGIGGSAQFELATKIQMVKKTSDLDLIVSVTDPLTQTEAKALLNDLNRFGVHVDLQMVSAQNGFSLEEYAFQQTNKIMLKTPKGPILTAQPWQDVLNFS